MRKLGLKKLFDGLEIQMKIAKRIKRKFKNQKLKILDQKSNILI